MNELNLILDQQLGRLEEERQLIAEAIEEINRRYGVLEDVTSWSLAQGEFEEEVVSEFPVSEFDINEPAEWTVPNQEILETPAAD